MGPWLHKIGVGGLERWAHGNKIGNHATSDGWVLPHSCSCHLHQWAIGIFDHVSIRLAQHGCTHIHSVTGGTTCKPTSASVSPLYMHMHIHIHLDICGLMDWCMGLRCWTLLVRGCGWVRGTLLLQILLIFSHIPGGLWWQACNLVKTRKTAD